MTATLRTTLVKQLLELIQVGEQKLSLLDHSLKTIVTAIQICKNLVAGLFFRE